MPKPIVIRQPISKSKLIDAIGYFIAGFVAANALYLLIGSIDAPPAPRLSALFSPLYELAAFGGGLLLFLVGLCEATQTIRRRSRLTLSEPAPGHPLRAAANMTAVTAVPVIAMLVGWSNLLHPKWLLVAAAFLLCVFALCSAIAAHRKTMSNIRQAINSALAAAPPWTPQIATHYSRAVRNSYLTKTGVAICVFQAPIMARWRRAVSAVGICLYLIASIVYLGLTAAPHPDTSLLPFCAFIGTIALFTIILPVADARKLCVTRLEIDTESRTYHLRTTLWGINRRICLRPIHKAWRVMTYSGNVDTDLVGIGGSQQAVAVWSSPEVPGALMSQAFIKPADAETAMCDLSALLQVPTLGVLDA